MSAARRIQISFAENDVKNVVFGHAYSVSLGANAEGEREYEASLKKGCIGRSNSSVV
jgi:hypothetical protein